METTSGTTRPVLAAFDGHELSPVRYAELLAGLVHAPLHIATAYRYEPTTLSSRVGIDPGNERRFASAEEALDHAIANLRHGAAVGRTTLPAGDTARALAEAAEHLDAAVIAVGPDDRRRHVVRDLARHVRCPLLIVPGDEEGHTPPGVVGVAFDGSVGSRLALECADRMAIRTGAILEVITVLTDARHADALRHAAEDAAAAIDGVEVRSTHLHGDPADALRATAERIDLLVCGSHGRGALAETVFGSVSAKLISDPRCPVLLVPVHARRDMTSVLGLTTAGRTHAHA